jgi:hypothetical protein
MDDLAIAEISYPCLEGPADEAELLRDSASFLELREAAILIMMIGSFMTS